MSEPRVRNWKVDFGRAVAGGVGAIVAPTVAGWPENTVQTALLGFVGLVAGLVIAFGAEYVLRLHSEVRRLHDIERQLKTQSDQHDLERRHAEYRVLVAQREAAVNAVWVKVWGGAYNEAMQTRSFLPVDAILARAEMYMKAENIDKPLPPFEVHPK
jgi:hypothetical protein